MSDNGGRNTLLILGACAVGMGGYLLAGALSDTAAETWSALPRHDASAVEVPSGAALVQATVAASNAPLESELVAYVREDHKNEDWVQTEQRTPELQLDGGAILSEGYSLVGPLRETKTGSVRYRGLHAGDVVSIRAASILRKDGTHWIQGDAVSPGTPDEVVARLLSDRSSTKNVALGAAGVGGVLLVLAAFAHLRRPREEDDDDDDDDDDDA